MGERVPIYEYQCKDCAAVTDIRHGFKEINREACPACAGEMKRLFTPTGIVFKGSGFYVTDSRKSAADRASKTTDAAAKNDNAAKSDNADKSDSAAKSDGTAKAESGAADSAPKKAGSDTKSDSGKSDKAGSKKGDAAA